MTAPLLVTVFDETAKLLIYWQSISKSMKIVLANCEHIEEVSRLFNQYCVFYQQPSNLEAATKFLQERFQNNDSTIFLASDIGKMVGLSSFILVFLQ